MNERDKCSSIGRFERLSHICENSFDAREILGRTASNSYTKYWRNSYEKNRASTGIASGKIVRGISVEINKGSFVEFPDIPVGNLVKFLEDLLNVFHKSQQISLAEFR